MQEIEKRVFISKEEYNFLIKKFNLQQEKKQKQVTTYYDCREDFRLMRTLNYLKIWMKDGNIGDESRQEKEVFIDNKYADDAEYIFNSLFPVKAKWFRTRFEFKFKEALACLDFTVGYGYILELEILINDEKKNEAIELIDTYFEELGFSPNEQKEIFKKSYKEYLADWQNRIPKDTKKWLLNND